jgi:pilus assembly protein CpaB
LRRTSRLLVVFGIGLAVLTFVLILFLLPSSTGNPGSPGATPTAPANVNIVVAAKDIPLGTAVTADMLSTSTIPAGQAKADAFTNPSLVIGQVARQAILTGEQLSAAQFSTSQTSITVPAGKRALAVEANELTGVGNLIFPGDTVDVVITLDVRAIKLVTGSTTPNVFTHDDALAPTTVKASALLQNIQVLGTLEAPVAPAPSGAPGASQAPTFNGTAAIGKLIVLAVTDDQAEAILFARSFMIDGSNPTNSATINLVLRATADASAPPVDTSGVDLRVMLEKYGVLPPYVFKTVPVFIPQQR